MFIPIFFGSDFFQLGELDLLMLVFRGEVILLLVLPGSVLAAHDVGDLCLPFDDAVAAPSAGFQLHLGALDTV